MPLSDQRGASKPVVIAIVCFVLAAAYVFFMFYVGRPKEPSKTSTSPSATYHVRLGAFSTAIDYAPMLVARSKGWIQQQLSVSEGAQIEFTTFQTLPSINEAFAANRLDAVVEAEVPAIVGRAAGIDIRITGVEATLTEGILVRSKTPIHTLQELKGRRVAVLSGTAMHFGLLNLLNSVGLNARTVSLINMAPPDAAAAFASGQIDGWAVWPPWPEQQVIANTGRFIPGAEATVQSVVVMRGGFINQGTAATALIRAIAQAKVWLAQNPSEGISLVAKELQLPEDVIRLAWPKHNWAAQLTPDVIRDIQEKASFLLNEKMIQNNVSTEELIKPIY